MDYNDMKAYNNAKKCGEELAMIVVINGTHGIGKSTTALDLECIIKDYEVIILEYDRTFQSCGNEILYNMILFGDGMNPQNNKYALLKFRGLIEEYLNTNVICIIPMAATTEESRAIIIDYIMEREKEFYHFVLEANKDTVADRIDNDKERQQKKMNKDEYEANTVFLNRHYKNAIRIDATHYTSQEIANIIGVHIGCIDNKL